MNIRRLSLLLSVLTVASIASSVFGDSILSSLSYTLCGFVAGVRTVVGLIAIALFLIGGVLYAIAHFLPTSVDYRKSLIGWSTAMIIGGIIGIVVVVAATPLVQVFMGFTGSVAGGSGLEAVYCP